MLLSFWASKADWENLLAGWVLHKLERTPVLPSNILRAPIPDCEVRVRRSEEDPRKIWQLITRVPFQLSQSYVVTVVPVIGTKPDEPEAAG